MMTLEGGDQHPTMRFELVVPERFEVPRKTD